MVCILGMHRSGTSCLAGILQQMGLWLGNINTTSVSNKKGNRENKDIRVFQDHLLTLNGGSWDNPPETLVWSSVEKQNLQLLTSQYTNHETWGFKDPRTLFTLGMWMEVFPKMKIIGSFRNPHAVAQSLRARQKLSATDEIELWAKYNSKLLEYQSKFKFPLINFDWNKELYHSRVSESARLLGLNNVTNATSFYDSTLIKNKQVSDEKLPTEVLNIYDNLLKVSDSYFSQ